MIIAETPRLIVRNWTDRDRPLFHEINSDPEVMAFFPMRRSRGEADAMMDRMRDRIRDTGFGFYALELRESGEALGFCGLSPISLEPFFPDGTIEIGWRLARRHWGRGYVCEAAGALLRYGFGERALSEIVSFAVHDNRRSTAVMERIGLKRQPKRDFDHPAVPASRPELKRHVTYGLDAETWRSGGPA
ncbi:MAG: GNAT family N-acetyltransferase [Pararhizobium sp.]